MEMAGDWADSRAEIVASVLVGSDARGNVTELSDSDLVLLILDPDAYVADAGRPTKAAGLPGQEVESWVLIV